MKPFTLKTFLNAKSVALFSIIVFILAVMFTVTNQNQVTADTSLANRVLHASDMTDLKIETWQSDEKIEMGDLSHPLNNAVGKPELLDSALQAQIMAYQEGYQTSAFLTWHDQSLGMGNYVYRYPSSEQAIQAQKSITGQFVSTDKQQMVETFNQDNIQGESYVVMGDQNDALYWFVGVHDDTVVMLMVDSISASTSKEAFAMLLDDLFLKQK